LGYLIEWWIVGLALFVPVTEARSDMIAGLTHAMLLRWKI
jgi:hypothetical protein